MKIAKKDLKDAIRLVFPWETMKDKAEYLDISESELDDIMSSRCKISQETADKLLGAFRKFATCDDNTPMSAILYAWAIIKNENNKRTAIFKFAKNNPLKDEEMFHFFDYIFNKKLRGHLFTEISLGLAIIASIIAIIIYLTQYK